MTSAVLTVHYLHTAPGRSIEPTVVDGDVYLSVVCPGTGGQGLRRAAGRLSRTRGGLRAATTSYGSLVASEREIRADPIVSARMRAVRSRDTRPELRIRSELHRRGLRYRVHRQPVRGLRRSGDIVFGPAKVIVMVDGCFWHGCPSHSRPSRKNHAFWSNKIAENQRRDRDTNRALEDAGWLVVRVWEHDDPHDVAARLEAVVAIRRFNQSRPP